MCWNLHKNIVLVPLVPFVPYQELRQEGHEVFADQLLLVRCLLPVFHLPRRALIPTPKGPFGTVILFTEREPVGFVTGSPIEMIPSFKFSTDIAISYRSTGGCQPDGHA